MNKIIDTETADSAWKSLYKVGGAAALRRDNKSYMVIATALGFVGIAVYFASSTAFSMLSLSDQYAAATTDVQRSLFLAAGHRGCLQ